MPPKFSTSTLLFLLIVCLYSGYRLNVEFNRAYPATRPNPITGDLRDYASILARDENPPAFQGDSLYGNGIRAEIYQTYSWLYLRLLKGLVSLSDGHLERALRLYSILTQAFYLPGMFFLLRIPWKQPSLLTDVVAGVLAFASLPVAGFLGTETHWGVPFEYVLPVHLSTTLSLYAVLGVYHLWFKKGYAQQPISAWQVAILGISYGILTTRLNLANGLALTQLTLLFALVQVLRRQLPFRPLWWFSGGFGLTFILLYAVFAPANTLASYPFASARAIIEFAQTGMVYPWGSGRTVWLGINDGSTFFLVVLGLHSLLTGLCLTFLWYKTSPLPFMGEERVWMTIFTLLQGFYMLLLMDTGWLPLLLVAYGLWRIGREEVDPLDRALALLLTLALMLGPLQQVLAYYIWQQTELVPLTGLLFELARFAHFAYLPFYLLLARAVWTWVNALQTNRPLIPLASLLLGGMVWLNLDITPYPASQQLTRAEAVVLLAILLWITQPWWEKHIWRISGGMAACGILAIGVLTVLPASQETSQPTYRYTVTPEYRQMTAWVKANTPPDSLFILSDLDGSFRYYAQRPLVAAREEWFYGMYVGIDPLYLKSLETRITLGQSDAQALVELARQTSTDYIVFKGISPLLIEDQEAIVYQNALYSVYVVDRLPSEQSILTQYPELYAAYQTHPAPLPPEAVIFNPATGTVAVRQTAVQQIAEAVPQADTAILDLLYTLQHSHFEAELALTPEQNAALQAWRSTKNPRFLRQAGIDYLFFDFGWGSYLTDAEYARLNDPNAYTLVQAWQVGEGHYWLYWVP